MQSRLVQQGTHILNRVGVHNFNEAHTPLQRGFVLFAGRFGRWEVHNTSSAVGTDKDDNEDYNSREEEEDYEDYEDGAGAGPGHLDRSRGSRGSRESSSPNVSRRSYLPCLWKLEARWTGEVSSLTGSSTGKPLGMCDTCFFSFQSRFAWSWMFYCKTLGHNFCFMSNSCLMFHVLCTLYLLCASSHVSPVWSCSSLCNLIPSN